MLPYLDSLGEADIPIQRVLNQFLRHWEIGGDLVTASDCVGIAAVQIVSAVPRVASPEISRHGHMANGRRDHGAEVLQLIPGVERVE